MADKEKIKEAIAKYFNVPTTNLGNKVKLIDLDLKSALVFELLCFIEIELDIAIPDKETTKITEETTIGKLVEFLGDTRGKMMG